MTELENAEKKIIVSIRNQVLAILVSACLFGLWMNYNFMTSINKTVEDLDKRIERIEDKFFLSR